MMNLVPIHLDICLYREWTMTMMMMRMPNKHWMHMDNADVVLVAVAVVRSASVYSEGVVVLERTEEQRTVG